MVEDLSAWRVMTVEQLCVRVTSGGTPSRTRPDYYSPPAVPWIKTGDLNDSSIANGTEMISWAGVTNSSATLLPKNTVLMAMYGATVGRLGMLAAPATCNQAACAMIADPNVCDAQWLFYALLSDRDRIISRANGAAQQNLSAKTIKSLTYLVPDPSSQRAIARVLGALDDKIAANVQLASAIVRLATAHFDKALSSRPTVDTSLRDIAQIVLGGTPSRAIPAYWANGTIAWLNSGKANEDRILAPSEWITREAFSESAAKWMPIGATVLAITGATLGQIARLEISATANQSLIGIWSDDPSINDWLYFAIQKRLPVLLRSATGAAQQHVNKRDVEELKVPVPTDADLKSWGRPIRPLLDQAASADSESLSLAAIRDALLPALMTGKIRVANAEKILEKVL